MSTQKETAAPTMTDLVVRRRSGLMAVVAVTALTLSAGYLWRFGQTGGDVALLLGIALGAVAILHGIAWSDARTPLLVADRTGLRVRLGGAWTGVPWSHVERVEVDERGRVSDGHVAVFAVEGAGELARARWRTRLGAALNRWIYDAPLVVPYGLTTIVTAADVPSALQRLAAGRAPVVVLDGELEEPEPTVAITASAEPILAEPDVPTDPRSGVQADVESGVEPGVEADVESEADSDAEPGGAVPGAADDAPTRPVRRPRLPLIASRESGPTLPLARVVAALRSHPAKREEVTLPVRAEHATDGTLALSSPYPDEVTEPLPEIEHLRRREVARADDRAGGAEDEQDRPVSNVGLIIDATTDLSARAMSKVRRGGFGVAGEGLVEVRSPGAGEESDDDVPLVIGNTVRAARERLGLSLDELADRTRIRPYVIESVEVDDFGPCGGDFYARGHLRMLARVLGLDPEPLLEAYDESFASSPINPRAVFDAELAAGATGMVRGGVRGANWGALIAAVLVLLLIWGVARYFADSTTLPGSQVKPNLAAAGSPGPGDKPKPTPQAGPAAATVRIAAVGGESRVVVKNRRGAVVWHGFLRDGDSHTSRGLAPLHVMAVDGGVIRLGTAGHSLGQVGEPGQRSRQAIPASPAD